MFEEYLKQKSRNKGTRKRLLEKRSEIAAKIKMYEEAKSKLESRMESIPNKYYSNVKKQIEEFQKIIDQYKSQIEQIEKYI